MKHTIPNFADIFTIAEAQKAAQARATYPCGPSPICLYAPEQVEEVGEHRYITLRLYYAIQVWNTVAYRTQSSNEMAAYWQLYFQENDSPFRYVTYEHYDDDVDTEVIKQRFWELLKQTANAGTIIVHEHQRLYYQEKLPQYDYYTMAEIVKDAPTAEWVADKYDYHGEELTFDSTPRTFTWDEIKDLFTELTQNQLALTVPKELHKHNKIDDILLQACEDWDFDLMKYAISKGANVNCLDKQGASPLCLVTEFCLSRGLTYDETEEERKHMEEQNIHRCKELVVYLLSQGADINLYGYDGETPLASAVYEHNAELIPFLLERGADPNVLFYIHDDMCVFDGLRSSIMEYYSEFNDEEYSDEDILLARTQQQLLREAGGRLYQFDYSPDENLRTGKFVVELKHDNKEGWLLFDNGGYPIGTAEYLEIEDADDTVTRYDITPLSERLTSWKQKYESNDLTERLPIGLDAEARTLAREILRLTNNHIAIYYKGKRITP